MDERDLYDTFPIDYDDEHDFKAFSAYDCTGLIPSAPTDDEEAEAYEDVYPYLAGSDEVALD